MAIERIYTVSLRKGTLKAPRTRRTKKAIRELGVFVKKHMKCSTFKLSEKLNEHIWQNGMSNPIMKVKIIAVKDDKHNVSVRLFGEKVETPKVEEKKPAVKAPTTQTTTKPVVEVEPEKSEEVGEKEPTKTATKKTVKKVAKKATKKVAKSKEE
ncbi:MAG: hypothetical protein ACMXYA_01365 [Candidatus Woesearchaeota archaeon]